MAGVGDTVQWHPTGLLAFDRMLGRGLPLGRMIEIFGDNGIGKTTLAFALMRAMQDKGHALYLDFEEALDYDYMLACGVNPKKLRVFEPDYMEQGLDCVIDALDKDRPHYSIFVIDSISEMTPKKELESSMEHDTVGLQARLMSQFCRIVGKRLKRSGAVLIGINQAREVIGGYGASITSSGGRAWKHKCAVRIYCTGGKSKVVEGGTQLRLWQKKNKVSATITDSCAYEIVRGAGIDVDHELLDHALQSGILMRKGGGNYAIGGLSFRGRVAAVEALKKSEVFQNFLRTGALPGDGDAKEE